MKILLIGGYGFFGNYIKRSFYLASGIDVVIGTRNPKSKNDQKINWNDPAKNYAEIKKYQIVINTGKWPENTNLVTELYKSVITEGGMWFETTADIKNTKILLEIKKELAKHPSPKGSIIFGLGVFPGLSNLLINKFLDNHPTSKDLTLAIRYNLFSGAGGAMCEMMSDSLTNPSIYTNLNL